jgi:hypothetical protein
MFLNCIKYTAIASDERTIVRDQPIGPKRKEVAMVGIWLSFKNGLEFFPKI